MLDFIAACNARAELQIPNFRQAIAGRKPSIFDDIFFATRTDFPHFGYVTCRNSHADTFYMLDNNDDAVAKHWYWYGVDGYEQASLREWSRRAKTAQVVFDIGSHTGAFSLVAARSNPAITAIRAFEPTARAYSRLVENLIANALLGQVRPERLAVSNKSGRLDFNVFDDLYQISTGSSYKTEHTQFTVRSHETCEATTIDAYIRDNDLVPDLVKIDVEGAEIDALEGAAELIARRRTMFLIEVTPLSIDHVTKLFGGYSVTVVDDIEDRVVSYDGQLIEGFVNLLIDPQNGFRPT
ncbi:MAG: FkbM family methyltransferase [Janthinobacterium lividum]